jgi:16S rRNA processing protein RimM
MKVNKEEFNNYICIASIGKPRGLKGEFFINSFCAPKDNLLNYSNFFIQDDFIKDFKIEYIKKINLKMYAKILGINDIDSIKKFTNLQIFINKNTLPEIGDNEAYWHELIGMQVIDIKTKDILGIVENLNNFGSNDCLELAPTKLSIDNEKRLIPFIVDKFISSINREESIIFVNWDKSF